MERSVSDGRPARDIRGVAGNNGVDRGLFGRTSADFEQFLRAKEVVMRDER